MWPTGRRLSIADQEDVATWLSRPCQIAKMMPIWLYHQYFAKFPLKRLYNVKAVVAEWYRYRIVACLVTSSSPVPLKTCRVEQRCTLNLSRAETSSRWCGVVVRRGGASSGVVHVT
ncbi:uncharacterized protein TNCV_5105991 [Trichonephila clavipes]|nr:uncharacterized protein TNCV_5105991 [Trichonephila clavipes]